jgi:hypothetical protein
VTRLVDEHGNQVLPDVRDEHTKITAWVAVQCLSADHRARVPVFANVAAHLYPTEDE